jgi:hypothetical protein
MQSLTFLPPFNEFRVTLLRGLPGLVLIALRSPQTDTVDRKSRHFVEDAIDRDLGGCAIEMGGIDLEAMFGEIAAARKAA